MAENNHPHKNVISNMKDLYPMISIINESKLTYVKDNLSKHLHSSQIELLKVVRKHSKAHHRKVRVSQYKQLQNNPEQMDDLYKLHENLYIKKYRKLEKKGLVVVDTDCEDLPFDVTLTDDGVLLLDEINQLEAKWEEIVFEDVDNKEQFLEELKKVTQKAVPINYNHKKQQKFVF